MRTVDNLLAEKGLLALAKTGGAPARVESLIDMDMDEIPELSPGTASYKSRRALRAQHKVKNAQNDKQRCRFYCEDATNIHAMLYKCAEVANKTLSAQMRRRCDMATQEDREQIPGHSFEGYWDGRMAYRLLWNELFACMRSEADKALYDLFTWRRWRCRRSTTFPTTVPSPCSRRRPTRSSTTSPPTSRTPSCWKTQRSTSSR